MSMAWVRKTYGVPAKRGGRVVFWPQPKPIVGTIVGTATGPYIRVRFDGETAVRTLHPVWNLDYLP